MLWGFQGRVVLGGFDSASSGYIAKLARIRTNGNQQQPSIRAPLLDWSFAPRGLRAPVGLNPKP